MSVADRVHELTLTALAGCTEAQRTMYMRVHGITEHHLTTEESVADVARDLGITRQAAHERVMAARIAVYQLQAVTFIREAMEAEAAAEIPVPGVSTLEHSDGIRRNDPTVIDVSMRISGAASWERTHLGAGSHAMENAEKSQSRSSSTPLRIAVHQAYSSTERAA